MSEEEIKYFKFCDKNKPIKQFCKSGFAIKNICKECHNKKQYQIRKQAKEVEKLQQENSQLKERIEKAIDWTIKYRTEWYQEDEVIRDLKQLLEILKGDTE